MTFTPRDLIAKYVELRDAKDALKERHKQELAPYEKGLEALGNALLADMQAGDVTSIKCDAGTAFQKQWMNVKTVDRDALFRHVIGTERWDLLTAAVSKDVVKEIIEESGAPPPGVDVTTGIEVQVRRGS